MLGRAFVSIPSAPGRSRARRNLVPGYQVGGPFGFNPLSTGAESRTSCSARSGLERSPGFNPLSTGAESRTTNQQPTMTCPNPSACFNPLSTGAESRTPRLLARATSGQIDLFQSPQHRGGVGTVDSLTDA